MYLELWAPQRFGTSRVWMLNLLGTELVMEAGSQDWQQCLLAKTPLNAMLSSAKSAMHTMVRLSLFVGSLVHILCFCGLVLILQCYLIFGVVFSLICLWSRSC
jgi:hypothetical protein